MVVINLMVPVFVSNAFTPPFLSTIKIRPSGRKAISIGSSSLPGSVKYTFENRFASGGTVEVNFLVNAEIANVKIMTAAVRLRMATFF